MSQREREQSLKATRHDRRLRAFSQSSLFRLVRANSGFGGFLSRERLAFEHVPAAATVLWTGEINEEIEGFTNDPALYSGLSQLLQDVRLGGIDFAGIGHRCLLHRR